MHSRWKPCLTDLTFLNPSKNSSHQRLSGWDMFDWNGIINTWQLCNSTNDYCPQENCHLPSHEDQVLDQLGEDGASVPTQAFPCSTNGDGLFPCVPVTIRSYTENSHYFCTYMTEAAAKEDQVFHLSLISILLKQIVSPCLAANIISLCQTNMVRHWNTYVLALAETVMCSGEGSVWDKGLLHL